MRVGYTSIFQGGGDAKDDQRVYSDELRLCDLAEPLGFEMLWGVEHHFTSYTMCPDPIQFLSYMAGRTRNILLGSGAVILPWHDPVRVAEQVTMLDLMSGGRFVFGMGRGLGRIEFEGLRVPMGESRARFVESAEIVLRALETGVVEADGKYYQIPKRDLRPRPVKSFRDRLYAAAVSPESVRIMADVGAGILINPQKDWDEVSDDMAQYREQFRELKGVEAPAPMVTGWVCCDNDPVKAKDMAQEYIGGYYESVMSHYELGGRHFASTQGYEYYRSLASYIQHKGSGKVVDNFIELQIYGTPDQCYERILDIRSKVGNDGFNAVCSFSGMSYETAEANMRLFAAEVMPRVKELPRYEFEEAAAS
ncbi:alkanesulfonate monooxygenase SsuD/methylene tetrahydromethanopterin reductase-like flavin-dependent oxidoreductase (luciferase family) [Amycolatopsis bartoniae]|uniref:Luciferase n=1 Tax=Amycolatopsis bartoniae TaxID=941986 RepID=A0A8H9IRL2_9PSEU|nr:LLM class flavin-dependent oxidoreductase [Amycolatopsis bartoniae]MBB2937888.1 alkanesulfonate monooxygenase SsuD/methylene tetrahydromethanopterin reductase-like flavin-dependent oxidoreductase (luciferase family) [Amycolatopsis bartoniae]TVT08613.1 LLM class flavin-dependent oxidoreductase [Amycolatopsis bartoniae]GHF41478.1 luciferase [Amycolatopsis bartoniae]